MGNSMIVFAAYVVRLLSSRTQPQTVAELQLARNHPKGKLHPNRSIVFWKHGPLDSGT